MSEPIVFITTMEIEEGKLEVFKEAVRESAAFIEANGPQMMVGVYIDEENRRARGIQVHRDSESILTHFRLADNHMRNVMQYITTKSVEFLGEPNEEVMQAMQQLVSQGTELTVRPRFVGFERFPPVERKASA